MFVNIFKIKIWLINLNFYIFLYNLHFWLGELWIKRLLLTDSTESENLLGKLDQVRIELFVYLFLFIYQRKFTLEMIALLWKCVITWDMKITFAFWCGVSWESLHCLVANKLDCDIVIFIIQGFRTIVFIIIVFPQRFGRYVLRPSSGVCQTREPTRNFELRPLLNPRGSPVLIPFTITGYKCKVFMYCYSPAVRIEPATSRWLSL